MKQESMTYLVIMKYRIINTVGNIWGLYTILTAPIAIKDRNITKVFRFFEELIYGYLEKKKLLKRGDFDD